MTGALELPALRGDDPLGFLAALGTLRLATVALGIPARLGFTAGPVPAARLEVPGMTLPDLAERLGEVARNAREEGRLLAGTTAEFPPPKQGSAGGDPARLGLSDSALWGTSGRELALTGDMSLARWLVALYCLRALDDKGRLAMTPFYAPSGQMTLAGNLAEPLSLVASNPAHMQGAFTHWLRVDFTGANLDHRALRDAGVEPSGKPANRGAPAPTWLALEGIGMGRVAGRSDPSPSVLWQRRPPGERGGRAIAMVWPTWTALLNMEAVGVLLDHPALQLSGAPATPAQGRAARHLDAERRALGIAALWRSQRLGLAQSDGPLMAAQQVWPAA